MFTRRGDSRIARNNPQNKNGRFMNRPYNQISAENLLSLPNCVIIGLHRRGAFYMLPIRADMESAPTTRGMGFARCNTKAKPAIKQNDKNLTKESIYGIIRYV